MFSFLRKLLSFIFVSAFLTLALSVLFESIVGSKADFKLANNIESIVVGHSHSACAFNDSILENFKNLSSSGESYFYTYAILNECLRQNPSIKNVFIEFSNNQIINEMDNWIWGDMYMSARYPVYSSIISIEDKIFLLNHNFNSFRNCFALSIKNNLDRIVNSNYSFFNTSGFKRSDDQKVDSILASNNADTTKNYKLSISENSVNYLIKIIQLCKKKNKRVILVRSPMHIKYGGYINEMIYQSILKKRFSDVEYIDCSKFPLKNEEFGDLEHLNIRGANRFSFWFQRNVLEKLSKKQFNVSN